MRIIKGFKKNDRREKYMEKIKTKDLFDMLLEKSTNDWTELCSNCSTLIKEAKMTNEDIDKIVESVKKENGQNKGSC